MPLTPSHPVYLTLGEAARRIGCSSTWVDQLHRTGRLPATRTGGRGMRLFEVTDVDRVAGDTAKQRAEVRA